MDSNVKTIPPAQVIPKEVLAKIKIPRRFEIFVEEYTEGDVGCQAGWRPVQVDSKLGGNGGNPIITVNSQADLQEKQSFYKAVGQRFRILREIDPPNLDAIKKAAIEQGLMKPEDFADTTAVFENETVQAAPVTQQALSSNTENRSIIQQIPVQKEQKSAIVQEKREIKYYKIGDVEIKDDNGCLYQKQWLRLSPQEESNYRIISDASNKVTSLKGKHIEAKKWVKIENNDKIQEGEHADA